MVEKSLEAHIVHITTHPDGDYRIVLVAFAIIE